MGSWKATEKICTAHTSKHVSIRWVLAPPHLRHQDTINTLFAADDGHEIGCLEWREDVLQESGAEYLVIQVSQGAEQSQLPY